MSLGQELAPHLPFLRRYARALTGSQTHGDAFVRAALDKAGLAPAAPAEPEVLLRRLSFVLTGLPPAPELRARFLDQWKKDAAAAYEKLVD